ncbi:MAG TPA: tetratricopeptide repeat protein [Novosphingobium sp.]
MTDIVSDSVSGDRLNRLLKFLAMDEANLALLADAADAAFTARQTGLAAELLDRYAALTSLPPELRNLAALIALAEERFDDAAGHLGHLRADGIDNPQVRFNLAWSLSMIGRHAEAADLLNDEAIAASPRGPTLKVQALHHLGDLDAALSEGRRLVERYDNDQALLGALAILAMDADDFAFARLCAERAADSPQGLAALGMLALDEGDANAAIPLFDRALARQKSNPRAQIGKGLALLTNGKPAAAAEFLEAGAAHFRNHLGSWIAAGWAYLVADDLERARAMFERTREIDETFSEGHGGLAVLAFMTGDLAEAEKRSEIALRLDRECLGGALAKIMLLEAQGETAKAARIRDIALKTPLGANGKTLLQGLTIMNAKGRNMLSSLRNNH